MIMLSNNMKENCKYSTRSKALTTVNVNLTNTDPVRAHVTQKERVRNWFIEPLKKLGGDDSIICLIIIMPILEKIIRHNLGIKPDQKLTMKGNGKVKAELAKILSIPFPERDNAELFWDCFRNGLMHRAMIKVNLPYILHPYQDRDVGRLVYLDDDKTINVHVWNLRDEVVRLLDIHGKLLWKDDTCQLPDVW